MIRLTCKDGSPLFVLPDNIASVGQSKVSTSKDPFDTNAEKEIVTVVTFSENNATIVTESPEEVARKVLEYKLAMDLHRTYAQAWMVEQRTDWKDDHFSGMVYEKERLHRLAGLEDTNDA